MGIFSFFVDKLKQLYRPIGEFLFAIINYSKLQTYSKFRGPPPVFPLGNIDELIAHKSDPWVASDNLSKFHGPVFILWIFSRPTLWVNDPQIIEDVMSRPDVFDKDTPCKELQPILGETDPFSHVGAEYERLVREYGIYLEASRREWIPNQVLQIRQVTQDKFINPILNDFKNQEISIVKNCVKLAQNIIVYCSVGDYPSEQQYNDWMEQATAGDTRIKKKIRRPPLSPYFYFQRWRLRSSYDNMIENSLKTPNHTFTPLANFLDVHRPNNKFVGEEIAEMLFGGAFSVGSIIGHCLFHLSKYPKYLIRLREEISRFRNWDYQTIKEAVFLDAVVREAGRITSVVPFWTRTSPDREVELADGRICPPNTMLFISNYASMRGPRFSDAHQFRPERWLDVDFKKENDYGSTYYFPQGNGPRSCKGFDFAWLIHRVAVAKIVSHLDLETTASELGNEYFFGTNVPEKPKGRFFEYDSKKYL
eukprot:TRINITY_DN3338_c0_g1_i1.p1 TRINITY_DN3338_c0_g1~~TRINITY_DN3338_c0_g1_i1.p1  ORF type:complete len:478 (+),score=76.35 TRINITY_DN3338_c0_g1_i1:116-1549(+)